MLRIAPELSKTLRTIPTYIVYDKIAGILRVSPEGGSLKHFMNQLRLCNRSRAVATHLASFSRDWTHSSETGATCRALSRGGKRRPQRRTTSSSDQPWATSGSSRTSRCKRLCGVTSLRGHVSAGSLCGPGRPGWLPTQVPHRSGLAHHAHPVPHLMNSRPARSVVGTWTWFRSRCTSQVSLQRLMRRHPLPLTGSLGLVPPLQRYYEVLRLPAAHFAALRFLRLAIPSLRPLFVPPGPGRGAGDQSGVGRRYLQPPCSMETTGSPKFPEEPL